MVTSKSCSEEHIPPQVGTTELVYRHRPHETNMRTESSGMGLLQQVGPSFSPKALAILDHWNSGLAKAENGYANGGLVIARKVKGASLKLWKSWRRINTLREAITLPKMKLGIEPFQTSKSTTYLRKDTLKSPLKRQER